MAKVKVVDPSEYINLIPDSCPFCGAEAVADIKMCPPVSVGGPDRPAGFVRCRGCDARSQPIGVQGSMRGVMPKGESLEEGLKQDAIVCWNWRV